MRYSIGATKRCVKTVIIIIVILIIYIIFFAVGRVFRVTCKLERRYSLLARMKTDSHHISPAL